MNKALDIAEFIIKVAEEYGHPVNNLQLQMLLYYVQKKFIEVGKSAFFDDMEAWKIGPVVPEVYHKYCVYAGMPIHYLDHGNEICIKRNHKKIIMGIVEDMCKLSYHDMSNDIKSEGKAWSRMYEDGKGDHKIIPKDLIYRLDCKKGLYFPNTDLVKRELSTIENRWISEYKVLFFVRDECDFPGDCGTKQKCKGCEYRNLYLEKEPFTLKTLINNQNILGRGMFVTEKEAKDYLLSRLKEDSEK